MSEQKLGFVIQLTTEVRNELEEKGKAQGGEKGKTWIKLSQSKENYIPFGVITEVCSEMFGASKMKEGSDWMTYILDHSELIPPPRPVYFC